MTHGQPFVGTDVGPMLLRKAGLLQKLTSLGWRVDDQGDLDFNQTTTPGGNNSNNSNSSGSRSSRGNTNANTAAASSNLISQQMPPFWGNAKNAAIVGRGSQQLCQLVATKMQQGRFPLILGGDHSIAIGSLAGILSTRPETGILWIDAHADLNTPDISESGNMHGMPVSVIMFYLCFLLDVVVSVVVVLT
jgi:arginase